MATELDSRARGALALIGALAGLSLWGLVELMEQNLLAERLAFALTCLAVTFFTALLALTGPLTLRRALPFAFGLGLLLAVLMALASLRFDTVEGLFDSPIPVLAGLVLVFVPLPFCIAASHLGWRDYPLLFSEAWTIVIRFAASWLFVGLVWLLIWLSDTLLTIVGITLIADLVQQPLVSMVLTGATLGLAMAVVQEMAEVVGPDLVLRLLRLLLPAVLLVLAVFLVMLPVRGLDNLFGQLSAATILLTMAATGATLVTAALDQSAAEATRSPVVRRAAQIMAALILAPAALGAWAVWLRVAQHGWTPDRVFAVQVAALGLGYGLLYLLAVLRGAGWEERVRQANITMALALIALAALVLTPVLNPERIAAQSQLARFDRGAVPAAQLDVAALEDWGRAGETVLAHLRERATHPGQEALATALASRAEGGLPDADALRTALVAVLPVIPPDAAATRDALLNGVEADQLSVWLESCRILLPDSDKPGCALVVADLWPDLPGEEAIMVEQGRSGWINAQGLALRDGQVIRPQSFRLNSPDMGWDAGLLEDLQSGGAPVLTPLRLNRLQLGGQEIILIP
ncbi:DUF4153 domain-containing protein [Gemmobacter denitrificans]|uniref:DUF4153 domain-containing protein n=1 Tax=Gemmobacter denitrificans TaxID=3123040 RepID=A0ABU8BWD8_9RHOB